MPPGASSFPLVGLARHGETPWSLTGQHTGLTDLPLTPHGEANARRLAPRVARFSFARVFVSPLVRARRTCELAGYGDRAVVDPDLVEWNYGDYEGKKTVDIRRERPDWNLFRDGCPGGESPADVAARARRVVARIRGDGQGNTLLFSSGHFLRALAATWLGLDVSVGGAYFMLDTASFSLLGYEHDRAHPVIRLWNEIAHTE
jgi:broad specificity phosphatase PhoE